LDSAAYNPGMRIEGVPFATIDWSTIHPTEHPGDTGKAIWQTLEQGNLRVRKVEYSPGYKANHWCSRGHVLHVMSGELTTELEDGRVFTSKQATPTSSLTAPNPIARKLQSERNCSSWIEIVVSD
jgi:hypothetical protein